MSIHTDSNGSIKVSLTIHFGRCTKPNGRSTNNNKDIKNYWHSKQVSATTEYSVFFAFHDVFIRLAFFSFSLWDNVSLGVLISWASQASLHFLSANNKWRFSWIKCLAEKKKMDCVACTWEHCLAPSLNAQTHWTHRKMVHVWKIHRKIHSKFV